jgi:hypothetical protein
MLPPRPKSHYKSQKLLAIYCLKELVSTAGYEFGLDHNLLYRKPKWMVRARARSTRRGLA